MADLTEWEQARRLAEAAGPVDVLVNNAGMMQTGVEEEDVAFVALPPDRWERAIDVNLHATFRMCRLFAPGMIDRGWGRIVNVSSVTGPYVALEYSVAYGAAKAGVDGLTRGLALELAPAVTVNSVAPGWIATGSSTEEELEAGRHTPAQTGHAGRGRRADRLPRVARRVVHHRPVDRDRRRQHAPGAQAWLGGGSSARAGSRAPSRPISSSPTRARSPPSARARQETAQTVRRRVRHPEPARQLRGARRRPGRRRRLRRDAAPDAPRQRAARARGRQARARREGVHDERRRGARPRARRARAAGSSSWRRCGRASCRTCAEIRRLARARARSASSSTVIADHGQWFAQDPELPPVRAGARRRRAAGPRRLSRSRSRRWCSARRAGSSALHPAFTGVDGQTSMLFGYESGAQAVLNCTSAGEEPDEGGDRRHRGADRGRGRFYAPTPLHADPARRRGDRDASSRTRADGLRHEADEVARCLAEGLLESPLMPLDETVSIMETMDEVLAQVAAARR